jgi:hypothetical protein
MNERQIITLLQEAAQSLSGILLSSIPGQQSDLDAEILQETCDRGFFTLSKSSPEIDAATFKFDTNYGRVELHTQFFKDDQIKHIRSGSPNTILADSLALDERDKRTVEIIGHILALGLIPGVRLNQPLTSQALLYLRPLPHPDGDTTDLIAKIVRAIQTRRRSPVRNDAELARIYKPLIARLCATGVARSTLAADILQTTILQEYARAAIKIEIWRKLWRWSTETHLTILHQRHHPIFKSDPTTADQVREIEIATSRITEILRTYVANATELNQKALGTSEFYLEAIECIIYCRENETALERIFSSLQKLTAVALFDPSNASLGDVQMLLNPLQATTRFILKTEIPKDRVNALIKTA